MSETKAKRKRREGPCPETLKARARRAAAIPAVVETGIGILRTGELAAALGVSRQTLYEWRKDGIIPEPDIKVGTITGWSGGAVRELLRPKPAA